MRLEVGQKLDPFVVEQVRGDTMRLVAALMDDPNPIHFNPKASQSLGLGERLVTQGPVAVGFLLTMIARNLGRADRVVYSKARFLGSIFENDRVECSGEIIDIDDEAKIATIACKAHVSGENVLTLTAQVDLNDSDLI